MEFRNPIFNKFGSIDCEINHPTHGWIPFTATEDDVEDLGRDVFASAKTTAAAYTPPPPPTQAELDAAQLAFDTRILVRAEFEYLLAYTGLEDVWDALEANYKPSDKAQYAFLKGTRRKDSFTLSRTLELVAQFRPAAASISPGTDLSDEAIIAAWALAAGAGI